MTSAILRFPGERLACFTSSFGAADVSSYRIVGTKGDLRVEPAYDFSQPLEHHLTLEGKTRQRTYPRRDQFGPELVYFSDCILNHREPEPSGQEGLADVRVVRALYRSAELGAPVSLDRFERKARPSLAQEIDRPPVRKPQLVRAAGPTRDSS
jgi:glucose-fructose oxidoreductase